MSMEMDQRVPDVVEDVYEGKATGVEVEDPGTDQTFIERPWNPEHIRVTTSSFSLRNIFDLIAEDALELAPDFQRGLVWHTRQKSLLVESLLLQIPLPAFYFAQDESGAYRVVDGLQRLSTLNDFVRESNGGFMLTGLDHLRDLERHRFNDLPVPLQRRINNTQLIVNVIDPSTPPEVTYEIFMRINTGGTPLNAQEIRHCMSQKRSRDILKRMTHMRSFDKATGERLKDHVRMNDREMALRFAAFWLQGPDSYWRYPVMEAFLMQATEMLDDPRQVPDERVTELENAFDRAMRNAHLVFGDQAFRKWPENAKGHSPINRALFESWSIVLADYETSDLLERRDAIVERARMRMTSDTAYLQSITVSTADRRRVETRFAAATEDAEAGR